ncbi:EscU/YscU/HrcU family type III secretion system export apparatus switch protein [Vicingaceae bacterium]|nr:EscU/YscU/HrcU family type III secretion system export apparatus switch protein [Vicingaceae bacterium]
MNESGGDRRHQPTAQHRKHAVEEGNVPVSRDLSAIISMLGAIGLLAIFGRMIWKGLVQYATSTWSGDIDIVTNPAMVTDRLNEMGVSIGLSMLMLIVGILFITCFGHLLQTRFGLFPSRFSFDIGRLSPASGISRIISRSSLYSGFATVLKIVVVIGVFVACVWSDRHQILQLVVQLPAESTPPGANLVFSLLAKVGLSLAAISLIDLLYQRWQHEQSLKMTDEELRDQWRSVEGDPQTNRRRNDLRQQLHNSSIVPAVNRSDFLLMNVRGKTIGVAVDRLDPKRLNVTIKGGKETAIRMRSIAERMGIRTVFAEILVEKIDSTTDVDQPIPPELCDLVYLHVDQS